MQRSDTLDILQKTGAFFQGHFCLSSGLHSGHYLQCAQIFRFSEHAERLAAEIARRVREALVLVDIVVSPALGGVLFGYEVSRALGTPNVFAERDSGNRMALRRGFAIDPGARCLVLEDVVTTGGSTREVMAVAADAGGTVAGVGCVADRSGGRTTFDVPFFPLIALDFPTYTPELCPLCLDGVPLLKPGSKK